MCGVVGVIVRSESGDTIVVSRYWEGGRSTLCECGVASSVGRGDVNFPRETHKVASSARMASQ